MQLIPKIKTLVKMDDHAQFVEKMRILVHCDFLYGRVLRSQVLDFATAAFGHNDIHVTHTSMKRTLASAVKRSGLLTLLASLLVLTSLSSVVHAQCEIM